MEEKIWTKLSDFRVGNIHVVTDFDKTLTTFSSPNSWSILTRSGILCNEHQKETEKLYQFYHPIELDDNLSFEQKYEFMDEWWERDFNLFIKYKITEQQIDDAVEKNPIILRDGVKEFFEKMHEQNIPILIISAGIGNVIEKALRNKNCYYKNIFILSNFIEFKDGKASSLVGKMIHGLNKNEHSLPSQISEKFLNRKNVFLFGDMIADNLMSSASPNDIIRFGFLNDNDKIDLYRANFDVILPSNASFYKILNALNEFINQSENNQNREIKGR